MLEECEARKSSPMVHIFIPFSQSSAGYAFVLASECALTTQFGSRKMEQICKTRTITGWSNQIYHFRTKSTCLKVNYFLKIIRRKPLSKVQR